MMGISRPKSKLTQEIAFNRTPTATAAESSTTSPDLFSSTSGSRNSSSTTLEKSADEQSAFFKEGLQEEIYITQLEGFTKNGDEIKDYKLKRALSSISLVDEFKSQIVDEFEILLLHLCMLVKTCSVKIEQRWMILEVVLYPSLCNNLQRFILEQQKEFYILSLELWNMGFGVHKCLTSDYVASSPDGLAIWLRSMLAELQHKHKSATKIYCKNKASIYMTKNQIFHSRKKNIDVRFHFIQDVVAKEDIVLKHCNTHKQLAHIFMKSLEAYKFIYLRASICFCNSKSRGIIED
uniref:Reverse transcriptase Ty1/copia-type domain-containing protein n=1 Tax=Solanum lycopersicum TaxID=4081 RepID=A0A3Q7EBA5_SOLLC